MSQQLLQCCQGTAVGSATAVPDMQWSCALRRGARPARIEQQPARPLHWESSTKAPAALRRHQEPYPYLTYRYAAQAPTRTTPTRPAGASAST
jgi:hypothetical protein